MNTGVYLITCKPTSRQYVGSAVNIKRRWAVHLHQLRRGTHHSQVLQRAWTKYGPDAFEFRVVVVCAPESLLLYEQLLIDGLNPALNICRVAGSALGVRHTAETRQKYRQAALLRVAQHPEAHAKRTQNANRIARELHRDVDWRERWLARVREHGETMANLVTFNSKTQSITQWASELGVPRSTLKHRIKSMGVEAAFTTPFVAKHSREAMLLRSSRAGTLAYEVDGNPVTKTDFAKHLGVSRVTLRDWEKRGLTQRDMEKRAGK
jgi:group I intron endonuclease